MRREFLFSISFILALNLSVDIKGATLVAHWRLDNDVMDSAGSIDGTLMNGPTFTTDAMVGSHALILDASASQYVDFGNPQELPSGFSPRSMTGWGKTDTVAGGYRWLAAYGTAATGQAMFIGMYGSNLVGGGYNGDDVTAIGFWETDVWHHICLTYDGNIARLYADGAEVGSATKSWNLVLNRAHIGRQINDAAEFWDGYVDDIRIYDYTLSINEIKKLAAVEKATQPDPPDNGIHPYTWVTLSWEPGGYAVTHDVYIGENYDNVNEGTGETFRGNQASTFYLAGFPGYAYPNGLVPGTTYYWRIDEVNEADPNSPWKGDVWSFLVPPKTAYDPNPADGAGFVDPNNARLTWAVGFGAKLHTVYFGDDFDEVYNATGGMPLGITTYTPGPLELEKVYYWRVDEFDAIETHKGAVWSFTTPGAVGNPRPTYDDSDVGMNVVLSWTASDSATSHQLYFGTDKEAVRRADTSSPEYKGSTVLGAESYDPGLLDADTTYAWRVDEVDSQGNTSKGPLWIFTTGHFLLVDDFESYTDDDAAGKAIWQTWIDGYGIADNGAQVGYLVPPYCEQTIVHGGSQSMPLLYANEAGVTNSEVTLPLTAPRDWTQAGVAELSLWFRGRSDNATVPLYVALSGGAGAAVVVAHDDSGAAAVRSWTEWRIPLRVFADQGIDLSNVDKIAIGLGSKSGMTTISGSGTIYIDDIRLCR